MGNIGVTAGESVYMCVILCVLGRDVSKGVTAVERARVCVCVVVGEALESLGVIGVRGSVFQHLSAGTGQRNN